MEQWWSSFRSALWNLVVHAVTLNWTGVNNDLSYFTSWWPGLWAVIQSKFTSLEGWAKGKFISLEGYAFGLYLQVVDKYNSLKNKLGNTINNYAGSVSDYIHSRIYTLEGYAYGLYLQVVSYVNSVRAAVENTLRPYIDSAVNWLRVQFEWIQPYRDLVSNWLVSARAAVDWLKNQAIVQLQAFLANPRGYVLGHLVDPIVGIANWWLTHGKALRDFVTVDLSRLRNLLERGYSLLMRFVDRPAETILELLAPVFLSWLEQLIADNW